MKNKGQQKHRGFTLSELLVAMGLGAFLMASVTQAYISSTHTEAIIHNNSMVQENGRFALQLMADSIRLAGLRGVEESRATFGQNSQVEFNDNEGIVFQTADHVVTGVEGSNNEADELYIRYKGLPFGEGEDRQVADCHGALLEDGEFTQMRFYRSDSSSTLMCASRRSGGAEDKYVVFSLITEIEDLQFNYGIDQNGDGSVDQYIPADDPLLAGADDWGNVLAVQISVTLNSEITGRESTFSQVVFLRNS